VLRRDPAALGMRAGTNKGEREARERERERAEAEKERR